MREIKFRCWDIKDKVMFSHEDLLNESLELEHIANPKLHHEFMQYTGLRDKNGMEIYRGDILSAGGLNYKLVWEDGKACELHNKNDKYAPRFLFNYCNSIEVAGNIYENPYLLNKI